MESNSRSLFKPQHYILEIILLLSLFYLPAFLVYLKRADLNQYILRYFLIALPQIGILLYILYIQDKATLGDFGIVALKAVDIVWVLLLFFVATFIFLGMTVILSLLPASVRKALDYGFRWKLPAGSYIPLVLIWCFITGYREELFFRSYLITRFQQLGISFPIAACISMSLFVIGHLYQGPLGIIYAGVQGLLFVTAFFFKKNIHVIALAHGLHNFAVLLLVMILPDW